MVAPRGIVFGLQQDKNVLLKLIPKNFNLHWHLFPSITDCFLSGKKNCKLASLIKDTGAWLVFLPHPEEIPLRRHITRAVLKSLKLSFPRPLRLKFYNLYQNHIITYDWNGSNEDFFPLFPKVSMIVRTGGSFMLCEALLSLAQQTYDNLEVILVTFGDIAHLEIEKKFFSKLDIKIVQGEKNRGKNLNKGIKESKGKYIGFLDEDDLIMQDHIEKLVCALQSYPEYQIAYSDTVLSYWKKEGNKIKFVKHIKTFNHPFNILHLFFENFLPLNSLLFKRELFLFEKFPEDIFAYEDWTLLVKLALKGIKFLRVEGISAEYRIFEKDLREYHRKKGFFSQEPEAVKKFLLNLNSESYQLLKESFYKNYMLVDQILQKEKSIVKKDSPEQKKQKYIQITHPPKCAVIISAKNTKEGLLSKMITSLKMNEFPYKIYLLDDGSITDSVKREVNKLRRSSSFKNKIFFYRTWSLGIANAYNFLASKSKEPFLLFADHDDEFVPSAIDTMILETLKGKQLVYAKSDIIDEYGKCILIQNKPQWSPDTLYSFNYINHPLLIHRDLWKQVNGFKEKYNGAQDWYFLFEISNIISDDKVSYINKVLYHWRAIKGSVALHPMEKPWAIKTAQNMLYEVIDKKLSEKVGKISFHLVPNNKGPGFLKQFYNYKNIKDLPSVRAIILTPSNIFRINQLLNILYNQDNYPNLYVTIVSNGSKKLDISHLTIKQHDKIEIINLGKIAFNWSYMNNLGVKHKKEDYLLFLNDDILPEKHFVGSMVFTSIYTGAPVVGATLYFPSGSLQHNGVTTSPCYVAREIKEIGAKGEFSLTRNVSAVTGAALLVKTDVFWKLNGFEEKLKENFNDVDFCVKARAHGYRVVLCREAEAIHFHMTSRKKRAPMQEEFEFMQKKWGKFLEERFYYKWIVKSSKIFTLEVR